MIILRQKQYASMKLTRGLVRYNKFKSRVGEQVAGIKAGILEGLYQNPNHPKVLRARAEQRGLRILRAGTTPYRAAINDQNRIVNTAAKVTTAVQNPGSTIADTARWAAENPGLAAGTATNYALVGSALASGNPALAARYQAFPFAPVGYKVDKVAQKVIPIYEEITADLGSAVGTLTNPIRDITGKEMLSVGRFLTGTALPGDFEIVSNMVNRTGNGVVKVGNKVFDLGKMVTRTLKPKPQIHV